MRKCDICKEDYDEQFITRYERIETKGNWINHLSLYVCENCNDPEWDEKTGERFLIVDGVKWTNEY